MDKLLLRKEIKNKIKLMDTCLLQEHSDKASKHLIANLKYKQARNILCYNALPYEADPSLIAKDAILNGKTLSYPYCINEKDMIALAPNDEKSFLLGAFGVLEPNPDNSKEVLPEEIDLIIVPGIAFDIFGGRLGRGAGFYDRFLKKTNGYKIGFCVSAQIIKHIPMEEHDCYMDNVIDETGEKRNIIY